MMRGVIDRWLAKRPAGDDSALPRPTAAVATADVCLIVEGCYPYVQGGVAGWIDWLMRSQPHLTFAVVALWPRPTEQKPRYVLPDNAISFDTLYLQDFGEPPRQRLTLPDGLDDVARTLGMLVKRGGLEPWRAFSNRLAKMRQTAPLPDSRRSASPWRPSRRWCSPMSISITSGAFPICWPPAFAAPSFAARPRRFCSPWCWRMP